MTDTILVGKVFPIGNLWGILLNDGTEMVGPLGQGMTKRMAEILLDAIEQRNNELRQARRLANTTPVYLPAGCWLGGV